VKIVLDKTPAEVEAGTADQKWMEGVAILRPEEDAKM